MAAHGLQPMPLFEPKADPTNTSARWTQWIERFNTFLIASNIKDSSRKRALLLYQAGPEAMKYSRHYQTQVMKKILIRLYKHLPNILNRRKIEFIKHICSGKQLDKKTKPLMNIICV